MFLQSHERFIETFCLLKLHFPVAATDLPELCVDKILFKQLFSIRETPFTVAREPPYYRDTLFTNHE
jgi:hypothetical protein